MHHNGQNCKDLAGGEAEDDDEEHDKDGNDDLVSD